MRRQRPELRLAIASVLAPAWLEPGLKTLGRFSFREEAIWPSWVKKKHAAKHLINNKKDIKERRLSTPSFGPLCLSYIYLLQPSPGTSAPRDLASG